MSTFLEHDGAGGVREVQAATGGGAGSEDQIVATDANGRIDESFLPTGIGADTANVIASEAISAGDLVNIFDDAGQARIRRANAATAGQEAHGFVKNAVASGAVGLVYFEGNNDAVAGLGAAGVRFLSTTTPGATQATAPTDPGNVVQRVGIATSNTNMNVEFKISVTLA